MTLKKVTKGLNTNSIILIVGTSKQTSQAKFHALRGLTTFNGASEANLYHEYPS
jgi:hypothetical protein